MAWIWTQAITTASPSLSPLSYPAIPKHRSGYLQGTCKVPAYNDTELSPDIVPQGAQWLNHDALSDSTMEHSSARISSNKSDQHLFPWFAPSVSPPQSDS